ncbi:MAG: histidinol dehydrogenase, partial [Thermomicrobiales bacterium]|nr:histidinol dehydrogenase [Thermomicrobiales bacterium]
MSTTPTQQISIRVLRDVDEAREALTRRRGFEETALPERVREGIRRVFGADLTADEVVDRILRDVRNDGDSAVRRYTREIDGAEPASFEVPREEWDRALA